MERFYSRVGTNTLDIREIDFDPEGTLLTNWGSYPEWLNGHQFVFGSGHVSDKFLMDTRRLEVVPLTFHFEHSGFSRAHPLPSGDLLLVGPTSGPQPPRNPVDVIEENNQEGRFTSVVSMLKKPYTGTPIPLDIPAWEGIAVSHNSAMIAWSDGRLPFYADTLIGNVINYVLGPSNIWVGEVVLDEEGMPAVINKRIIIEKATFGFVFLEPQNFVGPNDEKLTFNVYGVVPDSGDAYVYDFERDTVTRAGFKERNYTEWEGLSEDFGSSFIEVDENATVITGPGQSIDLYVYFFETCEAVPIFLSEEDSQMKIYYHEASFSTNGNDLVMCYGDHLRGSDMNSVELHDGFTLHDIDEYLAAARSKRPSEWGSDCDP